MPQMSALNWMLLIIYFFMVIFMVMVILSYKNNVKINEINSINCEKQKFKVKW